MARDGAAGRERLLAARGRSRPRPARPPPSSTAATSSAACVRASRPISSSCAGNPIRDVAAVRPVDRVMVGGPLDRSRRSIGSTEPQPSTCAESTCAIDTEDAESHYNGHSASVSRRRNDASDSYRPSATPCCLLLLLLSRRSPAAAQTTLGTIRGTVFDPQQQRRARRHRRRHRRSDRRHARGADRRAGTLRDSEPAPGHLHRDGDADRVQEGAADRRRAARRVRRAHRSEPRGRRPRRRGDGHGGGQNNITIESQAIARGLDEQQLRDLPRNSRDIQDFLTLNPNVVGGFDSIQFLGGRTYGASYIQDGQPSSAGIFGELSNAAPGPRRDRGSAGAVELVQRGVRRPRRCHRLDQARREPLSRHRRSTITTRTS